MVGLHSKDSRYVYPNISMYLVQISPEFFFQHDALTVGSNLSTLFPAFAQQYQHNNTGCEMSRDTNCTTGKVYISK